MNRVVRDVVLFGADDRDLEQLLRREGIAVRRAGGDRGLLTLGVGSKAPDTLVLDIRGANQLPLHLADVKRLHPHMGIVIVSSHQDPSLMLEAMRAGVTEWLSGANGAELKAAIERVTTQQRGAPDSVGQVYAFVGAKGGVGTTTTAVNTAAALSKLSSLQTLVIDLHLDHGDAAVFLGVEPRFSIIDAIQNPHRLDETFFRGLVTKTKGGPDLLASSERQVKGPVESAGIAAVIDFAARLYPYVVLDVPRSNPVVLDALNLGSRIVIVANQELAAVRSAGRLAASLRHRYGRDRVGIVLSRYDKNAGIARDDMANVLGLSVTHMFPSDYRVAIEALNVGRPLVLENHSRLASSYVEFTRALAGLHDRKKRDADKSGGLFDIFGRRAR